jgi:hypothetical protein
LTPEEENPKMLFRRLALAVLLMAVIAHIVGPAVVAQDPCPGNPLANASMEEGSRGTGELGTRPSSVVANAWNPWSVWGYSPYSQEAEFDVEDITLLGRYSTYRVHSGRFSQKFSSMYAVHNAGMYQRVPVPQGSLVTFSIWVQVYTGEDSIRTDYNEELISDLNSPGNYRVYVGIDPFGDVPPGLGAGPAEATVWSEPVLDRETRRFDDKGLPFDGWVQIQVQARAEADHVTVYTRGQPEFPVKFNVSYWDDGCVTFVTPTPVATATPEQSPTAEPTPSPTPTASLVPTATLTETSIPTPTPLSTETPLPTQTALPTATQTSPPTVAPAPTETPASLTTPTQQAAHGGTGGHAGDSPILLIVFGAVWLSAAAYILWTLWSRRQTSAP